VAATVSLDRSLLLESLLWPRVQPDKHQIIHSNNSSGLHVSYSCRNAFRLIAALDSQGVRVASGRLIRQHHFPGSGIWGLFSLSVGPRFIFFDFLNSFYFILFSGKSKTKKKIKILPPAAPYLLGHARESRTPDRSGPFAFTSKSLYIPFIALSAVSWFWFSLTHTHTIHHTSLYSGFTGHYINNTHDHHVVFLTHHHHHHHLFTSPTHHRQNGLSIPALVTRPVEHPLLAQRGQLQQPTCILRSQLQHILAHVEHATATAATVSQ
jgi:hypothetical protein